MVSNLSIVFMIFSTLISIGLPIALTIYIIKKERASFKSVLVGALVFFVAQIITRIPLLQFFSKQTWYFKMSSNVIVLGLFLGITAGLFEEIGRFLGFKFLLKNKLNWGNGVAFGIGHGGIEAILLVGISNINSVIYSVMINTGSFDITIASKLPPETVYLIKNQLINTASSMFLAGGIERLFTIIIQIALSLIVLYGVMNKSFKYVLYAILFHTLLNAPLPLLMTKGINIWLIEAIIGVFAVIGLYFIVKSKDHFNNKFSSSEKIEL